VRRPERNIEIFSMSVLDMFASALGAFIIVAVILFPYFNQHRQLKDIEDQIKVSQVDLNVVKAALSRSEDESRRQAQQIRQNLQAQAMLTECQGRLERCRGNLSLFLVVAIEWDDPYDIDLIVKAPDGFEFSYSQKTRPPPAGGAQGATASAELSLDMLAGPGIEVWQDARPVQGDYTVYYSAGPIRGTTPVAVQGWTIDRVAGRRLLEKRTLKANEKRVLAATLKVESDGKVTITQPSP
jgi:hypothetical protein